MVIGSFSFNITWTGDGFTATHCFTICMARSRFVAFVFSPQPLRAVGVLFSPMVSGWEGVRRGGQENLVRAISQKP